MFCWGKLLPIQPNENYTRREEKRRRVRQHLIRRQPVKLGETGRVQPQVF